VCVCVCVCECVGGVCERKRERKREKNASPERKEGNMGIIRHESLHVHQMGKNKERNGIRLPFQKPRR